MPAKLNSSDGSLEFVATINTTEFRKSIDQLKIQVESVEASANRTKDPLRLIEYNKKSQELQAEIGRMKNVGRDGFDALGNKIQGNANLLGKLSSGLSKVAMILPGIGIAGIFALALEPLFSLISNLDLFKKKLSESEVSAQTLSKAFASSDYTKAVKTLNELKTNIGLAKEGLLDKEKVLNQYNETIGITTGQVNNLQEAEAAIVKNGEAFIQITLKKAAAQLALENAAKKSFEAAQELNKSDEEALGGFDSYMRSGMKKGSKEVQDLYRKGAKDRKEKAAEALEKEQDQLLDIAAKFQKEAAEIAEKNGFNFFGIDPKQLDKEAKAVEREIDKAKALRRRLLSEIDKINTEYSRKSLSKDEEELQAVRDKFKKIKSEVAEFNRSKEVLNNPVLKISTSSLNKTEDKAINDLKYQQETERLKIALEEAKGIFSDYEQARAGISEEYATKRYGVELEKAKETAARAKLELQKLNSMNPQNMTGGQLKRKEDLTKLAREEEQADTDRYETLLKAFQSFDQQRTLITQQYHRDRAILEKEGNSESLAELERSYKDKIAVVNKAEVERDEILKKFAKGFDDVTSKDAKKIIQAARDQLKILRDAGKITLDEYKDFLKRVQEAEEAIALRLPDKLNEVSGSLREMAGLVGKIDEKAGQAINSIANLAGGIASVLAGVATGDPLAVISGAIQAVSAVYDFFDRSDEQQAAREERQRLAYEKTQLAIESMNRALEKQAEIIEKALGIDRISAYRNQFNLLGSDITRTVNELNKINYRVDNGMGRSIEASIKLAKLGDVIAGIRGTRGEPDTPGRVLSTLTDVLEENRKRLEQLYRQIEGGETFNGQIDQVRELISTYEDLEAQLEEYKLKLQEVVTGTTFSSIVDSIAAGFREGKSSIEDFADNFEDLMRTAIIESLKMKALEKPLKEFYDQFAKFSESGGSLDEAEIAELREVYNKIIGDANKQFTDLKNLTGVDFTSEANKESQRGLAGEITSKITEETGSLVAGRLLGIQTSVLEISKAIKEDRTNYMQLGLEKVKYLEQIEQNTRLLQQQNLQTNAKLDSHTTLLSNIERGVRASTDAIIANGG